MNDLKVNELHYAVCCDLTEHVAAVLSRGVVGIDERTPDGFTPLMIASGKGYSRVVSILLNKGANVALLDAMGFSALHLSAQNGHVAVTTLLVRGGADLEGKTLTPGCTPLDLAAELGHSEIMRVLIEAGANPNSRRLDGATPLFIAANEGHVDAVKVLLCAKANPLLAYSCPARRDMIVPLDVAAEQGRLEVARELIKEHGIGGCGGASGGVNALKMAAENQQVEMMEMLTCAGVVDTGVSIRVAAFLGKEPSVKFLLQQGWKAVGQAGYLDFRRPCDVTTVFCSIQACRPCSPRITRLLVDAGADTTTSVQLRDAEGTVVFYGTALAMAETLLNAKKVDGKDATESQLHSLKATRRLLMRLEAVHAVSWLWPNDVPSVTDGAAEDASRVTRATSTPLNSTLSVLRRRAGRSRVLLAALFRHSRKPY